MTRDRSTIRAAVEVVDASGSTIVPGMVDAHSHLTMPGGAHWIDRGSDPTERLLAVAEANARLLTQAGVRWARDVGSVRRADPEDGGRERALALGVRDRWRGRAGLSARARGGHLDHGPRADAGALGRGGRRRRAPGRGDRAARRRRRPREALPRRTRPRRVAVVGRRARGAWSTAVHARGARVTAHSGYLAGARAGADRGRRRAGARIRARRRRRRRPWSATASASSRRSRSWPRGRRSRRRPTSRGSRVPEGRARTGGAARTGRGIGRDRPPRRRLDRHRHGLRRRLDPGEPARLGGRAAGRGRPRRRGRRWAARRGAAASCWPSPTRASIREGGPADFALVHGDPLSDPAALWRVWHVAWAADRLPG